MKPNTILVRLNKYLSQAGAAPSRRKADELIEKGLIKVNGKKITELGFKVNPETDSVEYQGKVFKPRIKHVYLLLNKPKDSITTTSDERDRRTVLDLIPRSMQPNLKPVGRLDRDTTGLLLLTTDNELITQLTHPSSNIKKLYKIETDQIPNEETVEQMKKGVELEDGFFKPDKLEWIEPQVFGMELHSGRNRIIRRYFEAFSMQVIKLDRVIFAGLTKYKVPRGKFRTLDLNEIRQLKKRVKS